MYIFKLIKLLSSLEEIEIKKIKNYNVRETVGGILSRKLIPIIVILAILIFLVLRYNLNSYWVLFSTNNPFMTQLVLIAIIWIGAVYVVRLSIEVYIKVIERVKDLPLRVSMLIKNLIKISILVVAVIWTLGVFELVGIIQGLLVGAGFAGIVLGLAAQQTFSNFISGVSLILDKPFKIGDWIHLKGKNIVGTVRTMSLRSITIVAPDNTPINLPNSMVDKEAIVNYSEHRLRRLFHKINISYESDVSKAIKIIQEVLRNDPATAKEGIDGQGYFTPIEVVITKFGESSVNMEAKVFVDTTKAGGLFETESRMLANIKNALTVKDIEIPYPKTSVILEKGE